MVLTEVGPDREALRAEDRAATLFDLGLGTLQLDACVRIADADVVAALRNWVGRSLFEAGNGAMGAILAANPNRVFFGRIGRVEVYQPIPPPNGRSPEGPHTHILPRTAAASSAHTRRQNLFRPAGFHARTVYPPHPARDAFGHRRPFCHDRHASFQKLLVQFGDLTLLDVKRQVFDGVAAASAPAALSLTDDRFSRATLRVALRQMKMSGQSLPAIEAWLAAYDRVETSEAEEEHPCTA